MSILSSYSTYIENIEPIRTLGKVVRVKGLLIESLGPTCRVGEVCFIHTQDRSFQAQVIGLANEYVQLMAYADVRGIEVGDFVSATHRSLQIPVGPALLGRLVDGCGRFIDNKGPLSELHYRSVEGETPDILKRKSVNQILHTGIKSVDLFLTVGKGQRMGIFSGSGVGKSSLLAMMARNSPQQVNVIVLVGERSREAKEFIETELGPAILEKTVLIVALANESALMRVNAVKTALTIAEYFRDRGNGVLFLCDSLTRLAHAQREVGLSLGELPSSRGYTPSVFALLPHLLERSCNSPQGVMTSFYTVLVDGDDFDEPITDAIRGILDGHIILDRQLAEQSIYPAVDVLKSLSRLFPKLVSDPMHRKAVSTLRRWLSLYNEQKEIIQVGAYTRGVRPELDKAMDKVDSLHRLLQQDLYETVAFKNTLRLAQEIVQSP